MDIFVGRQPILDINEEIYGYELLYREGMNNSFPNIDPDKATVELLVNTFVSIGKEEIIGKNLSFINFTSGLLTQDIFDGLNPETVVIEILEDVAITPALLSKLQELKEKGFRLALDDFVLQEQYQVHQKLFEFIDYIKVDFLASNSEERVKIEQFIKKYSNIVLLAEKVETKEDFEKAKAAGYKLFQGYFFAKPEIIKGFEMPPKPIFHLQIIDLLNAEEPNIDEIATFIKRDISLSYRLLRMINSPGIGVTRKISSIKQAIVILGLTEMKKWVQILALRELDYKKSGGRIQALIDYSLARAKLCELLAKETGKQNPDEYFLAGLFSLMDIILKQEWKEIFLLIPLSDNVMHTLTGSDTEIKPFIELVEAIERLEIEKVMKQAGELKIDAHVLGTYSQRANHWARMLE